MFSLALCTYNRDALLGQALGSLAVCRAPAGNWELLLIDNNSRDQTRAVAESFIGRLPLRYVFEPEQGLSAARNRALRECRGQVLLFTDDDVRFDLDWLVAYEQAFAAQPDASWFGGRIRPLWQDGPPRWLRDESMALIAGLLVYYDLGAQNRSYLHEDPCPFGASFALRRPAFEQMGGFRTDLGVRGDVPGRGEEEDYFQRLKLAGFTGFYVGATSAWHGQDPARFRWGYLYRYGIQKGVAIVRMGDVAPSVRGSRLRELEYGLKGAWQLLKGRGDRARQCIINMGITRGMRASGR
ncbi:MAG: glycosyltransferase family 2 protein [Chromatiaceae bacterium]|nr:glycosyltransferase family 2 protein [Chromatiaceae bacterium]